MEGAASHRHFCRGLNLLSALSPHRKAGGTEDAASIRAIGKLPVFPGLF
ncbi:hypothetical protein [Flavobacterium cyanobacteriorum]|nr:hypothetical protein [Flavobacterium cyanobacteriorum]